MKLKYLCLIVVSTLLALMLICYQKAELFYAHIRKSEPPQSPEYSSTTQSTPPDGSSTLQTTEPTSAAKATDITSVPSQSEYETVSRFSVTTHQVKSLLVLKDETSIPSTSYILALHTAEQLTNGVTHFIEFLNMARQWNLTGVEPLVYRSRTFALRSMHPNDVNGSMYYHQLLNVSLMRDKLNECFRQTLNSNATNTQLFVSLNQFLIKSVRTITLVYFPKHMIVIGKDVQTNADKSLNKLNSITECTETLKRSGVSESVEALLNQELIIEGANDSLNFRVIQAFCVPKVEVSLVKIREYILSKIHRDKSQAIDVSIIFISWQGRFTRPFTDMDTIRHCRLPINLIAPNKLVISKSDQFIESLGLQRHSYIGIHIRFEKLFATAFKYKKDPGHYLDCCMLRLNAVLKQVKILHNLTSEGSTLLLHDYSLYGTDVCQHGGGWQRRPVCVNKSRYLLSLLNESRASEFDPVKFAAPQNSGFVSLVEGLALAGARTLVVMGGGGFQISITERFRSADKNAEYYSLCTVHEKLPRLGDDDIKECTHHAPA